ncbi:hypothetical protein LSH36_16g04013 [Paralvinella palmiformis]|uniref:C2H2-type domain-containing protein n=1 Tax=Paralvinella palmiformis TaxID=53620 RepID=A0AAD9NHJ2_9ANNE|nr:hypothetical protein LSH36_16g04013 [Paralvinella palmiformis]
METGTDEDDRTIEPVSVDTSETETVSLEGDGISIKSQELPVTPRKPSSGGSTPSDKRSASPSPSNSKHTPVSGGSKSGKTSHDGIQSPDMHPNRPSRPGITWIVNGKLEAMDFQQKWYPARIVDMDDTDNTVLIHFDGWNQRYDEWVTMDSERLRPLTRSSGRKDKKMTKKSSAKLEHKVGDNVFAKWTDCRMYPGTIAAITPNESYEVLFYDGFKKIVQPINVKTMPIHVQKEYAIAGMLPHPSSRPHQKLQMLEKKAGSDDYKRAFKQTKFAKKAPRAGSQSADEVTSSVHRASSSIDSPEATNLPIIKSSKLRFDKLKRRHKHKALEDRPLVKKAKLVVGGKFQVKMKSRIGRFDARERPMRIKTSETMEEKRSKRKQCILNVKSRRGFKSSVDVRGTRKRAYKLSKTKKEQISDDEVVLAQLVKPVTVAPSSSQEKSIPTSSGTTPPVKATKSVKHTTSATDQEPEPAHVEQPKKAFHAAPEQKFTCPFKNCNKSFRKMSLVEYHVKYYHTEDGNVVQAQPPRKRRKTSSICSSDSEVSFPVKQIKKHKENSLPVIQSLESPIDSTEVTCAENTPKQEVVQGAAATEHAQKETTVTDSSDVAADVSADCLSKDEVVNCICQLNEENGLMIQCEMCLCWQHAVCMGLMEETLPAKYICYICSNPPGIRDSARYSYDQDWLKQGTMAKFNFLPDDPHFKQKAQIMLATHSLVSDLHGVDKVLSSLKCQLHANKDKNHPEVKFWTKNWDKVMEERQFTKTSSQQAALCSQLSRDNTVKALTEVGSDLKPASPDDVKLELGVSEQTFGHLDVKQGNIEQDSVRKQDAMESKLKQMVNDQNLQMKEEVGEQSVPIKKVAGEEKPLVKNNIAEGGGSKTQQETYPTKSETKQELTIDQTSVHKSEVKSLEPGMTGIKEETVSDVCSDSAGHQSLSRLQLKHVSSQEQLVGDKCSPHDSSSTEKSDLPMHHDSNVKEGDAAVETTTPSSVLGSDKLMALSENTSSSSLSSLNEDTVSKSITHCESQDSDISRPVVTIQEQPFVSCEHNLLEHISFMQDNVDSRLDLIEEQISVLENADDNSNGSGVHDGDVLRDVPRVKKAMHQILNDLFKVKRMALYR